jgi:tetratricopeptide (TPR) repeat protein
MTFRKSVAKVKAENLDDRKSLKKGLNIFAITEKIRNSIGMAVPLKFDEDDETKYILKYEAIYAYQDIEDAFYKQLGVEFNTAPLDFIREYRDLKIVMSDYERIEITRKWISNYIKPQAPNELNISGKARNKILTTLKESNQAANEYKWVVGCTVSELFEHIDRAMKKDLQIDSFPRFADSSFWKNLLPKYKDNEDVVDVLKLFEVKEAKAFEKKSTQRDLMDEKLVLQFLQQGKEGGSKSPKKVEKSKKFIDKMNQKQVDLKKIHRKSSDETVQTEIENKEEKSKEEVKPEAVITKETQKIEEPVSNPPPKPATKAPPKKIILKRNFTPLEDIPNVEETKSTSENFMEDVDFENLRKGRINRNKRDRKENVDTKIKKISEKEKQWNLMKYSFDNEKKQNDDSTSKLLEEKQQQFEMLGKTANSVEFKKMSNSNLPKLEPPRIEKQDSPKPVEKIQSPKPVEKLNSPEPLVILIPEVVPENLQNDSKDDGEDTSETNEDEIPIDENSTPSEPIDPEKALEYFRIAGEASANKEFEKAIDYYDLAIEYDCELKEAYFNRGVLNYSCHRYLNSILDMVKVITKDPKDGKAYSTRGRALKQIGQYKMAIEDLIISSELENIPNNYMLLGICYDKINMKTEAIEAYSKFIDCGVFDDDNNLMYVYSNRALNYYQKYKYEQALADYTMALKYCKDDSLLRQIKSQRAKCHKAYGNIQQANQDLKDSYTDVDYYNNGVHAMNAKNYAKAYENFTQAILLKPNEFDYYFGRSVCAKNLGNLQDAIFDLVQTVSISPEKKPLMMLAKLYISTKAYEKALEVHSRMLKLDPDDAQVYFERGNVLADMEKNNEAIENYTEALTLKPQMSVYYFNRGLVYFRSQDYKKALTDYTKSIQYDPENGGLYVDRGLCYYYLGMDNKAIEDFEYCLELDPGNERAQKVLSHFE